jgi:hypothetical protein
MRLRTLADRLAITEKDFASVTSKAGNGLKALIIEAALGAVPPGKEAEKNQYKSHAGTWFKSVDGGREPVAGLQHHVDAERVNGLVVLKVALAEVEKQRQAERRDD